MSPPTDVRRASIRSVLPVLLGAFLTACSNPAEVARETPPGDTARSAVPAETPAQTEVSGDTTPPPASFGSSAMGVWEPSATDKATRRTLPSGAEVRAMIVCPSGIQSQRNGASSRSPSQTTCRSSVSMSTICNCRMGPGSGRGGKVKTASLRLSGAQTVDRAPRGPNS